MKRIAALILVSALPLSAYAQVGSTTGDAANDAAVSESSSDGASAEDTSDSRWFVDAAPTPIGATGLLRTYQATGLEQGTLALTLQFDYFAGSDVVRSGDEARRFLGHLGISWTPLDFLEAFVALHARAVTNTLGDPELVQSVGDVNFGAKGFYAVNDIVSVGGMLNINLPAGANQVGLDLRSTGVDIIGMGTFDLRAAADIPLRLHLNIGYLVDNQASLFPFMLDRVERFGQGIYDYDRVFLGLSADAPMQYITPFVEWTLQWPNGAKCEAFVEQQCVGEAGFATYPSFFTFGARSEVAEGLTLNLGVDIGVTTAESQGTPAIPGWNLAFGIAYNFDPTPPPPETVEVPVEVAIVASYVEGTVVEAGTGNPIDGARIRYVDTDYTDQITGPDGTFRTFDFEPGTELTIEISHPEYVTRPMRVAITEEVLSGAIDLEPSFTGALVTGSIATAGPADVTVSFRGAQDADIAVGEDGTYEVELEPGEYRVIAHAPGLRAERARVTLEAGRHTRDWTLEALDPGETFRLTADGFVFADPNTRVAFAADGTLPPDSTALLDQVATFLNEEAVSGRVLVRSHTDPRETIEEELGLTAARAATVIDYLVSSGVPAGRLEADGVGSAEPLFPNVTDRNRRQNNRIEFQFLYE